MITCFIIFVLERIRLLGGVDSGNIDRGREAIGQWELRNRKQTGRSSFGRVCIHVAAWIIVSFQIAIQDAGAGDWRELASLPDAEGFAGAFAGVSHDFLIVAGGQIFQTRNRGREAPRCGLTRYSH